MGLQQCHECKKDVSSEAKLCPNCGAPVKKPTSMLVKIGVGLLLFLFIGFIGILVGPTTQSKPPVYTAEQKKAAEDYQKILTDGGIVVQFKGEGKIQVVYVDRKMWNIGTFENKKKILKALSQSNEILGRTPWIEIRDHRSGKVYGALKPPLTNDIYE